MKTHLRYPSQSCHEIAPSYEDMCRRKSVFRQLPCPEHPHSPTTPIGLSYPEKTQDYDNLPGTSWQHFPIHETFPRVHPKSQHWAQISPYQNHTPLPSPPNCLNQSPPLSPDLPPLPSFTNSIPQIHAVFSAEKYAVHPIGSGARSYYEYLATGQTPEYKDGNLGRERLLERNLESA
jgi:hypothetical protein